LYFVQFQVQICLAIVAYRDKKVVGVFVRFRCTASARNYYWLDEVYRKQNGC
jgi:hypothetical protein